jgi:hypothetical protein
MKIESKPNAISWKKNPNRHIAEEGLARGIKTFSSLPQNRKLLKPNTNTHTPRLQAQKTPKNNQIKQQKQPPTSKT